MIENSPEESTRPLSGFEESILQYIERAKTNYNIAKEQYQLAQEKLSLVNYFEKYHWLTQYIKDIEIFHINELYDYIKETKDLSGDRSKKLPDRKTISRYLFLLFKEGLLGHKPVPSNYPNMYKFYWIPQINEVKRLGVLQAVFDSYKEPRPHKKEKRKQQYDNTVQARITTYKANKDADKIIAGEEKELVEKQELERQKQRELEKQQKEIENKETNERRKAALIKHSDKETVKKTKDGSRTISPEESKKKVDQLNKERKLKQEKQEYQAIKEKLAREKAVSEEGG